MRNRLGAASNRALSILSLIAFLAALLFFSFFNEIESYAQSVTADVLDPPALAASLSGSNTVDLSWNAVNGAVRYELWVWRDGGTAWQRLDDGALTGTFFRHGGVATGTRYHYAVRAVAASGVASSWSAYADVTVPEALTSTPTATPTMPALSAPTLTAVAEENAIDLSWTQVTGAARYELWVWTNVDDWERLDEGALTGSAYTHSGLTQGRTYYYLIRAVGESGVPGPWSEQAFATAGEAGSGTAPTPTATVSTLSRPVITAEAGAGVVNLRWEAVAGAVGYELWTWTSAGGWQQLGDSSLTVTTYTHEEVTAGTTYYYAVRAADAQGGTSDWSEFAKETASESTLGTATATATATLTATATATATPTATPTVAATPATTERGALIALYESTDGDNWKNNSNWLSSAPLYSWYGVITDGRGRVTRLSLGDNGLTGTIPVLSALTELEELNLRVNRLTGPIPELGALRKLKRLYLEYNDLTGPIPELSALTNLHHLYLGGNRLTGQVPNLDALTYLSELDLYDNKLAGPIPDLSRPTGLIHLSLSANQLTGSIPDLSALRKLRRLFFDRNRLTGTIPDLSQLTRLGDLKLSRNMLTGSIPDMRGLTNIWALDLSNNQLTGTLPDLSSLTGLTALILNDNQLTGAIPNLSSLTDLEWLHLNSNQLSGQIPDLSTLTKLISVNLRDNLLTGPIPDLSTLTDLSSLDLSNNRLTGPIPEISVLPALRRLDLAGNQLCLIAGTSLTHSNRDVDAHLKGLNPSACTEADLSGVLGAPKSFEATVSAGQVTLTWDAVEGASGYELRVWDSLNREWGTVGGVVSGTSFTHNVRSDGRNYYYNVRARGANGVRSSWSGRVRAIVVQQQFLPPPLSLGLDLYYQKYLEVDGVVVVAPTEVSDGKMVQAREIVSGVLSGNPNLFEAPLVNYLRISIYGTDAEGRGVGQLPDYSSAEVDHLGAAFFASGAWVAGVPEEDSHCLVFIHEFAHSIHSAKEDLPSGSAFNARLQAIYQSALAKGLWRGAYASTNVREYWADTVAFWFQESISDPSSASHLELEEYDPEIAEFIEEMFGDASVPSYCKP